MTIDSKNSVRIANSTIRNYNKPQGIVSTNSDDGHYGYDGRLFFCPNLDSKLRTKWCAKKGSIITANPKRKDPRKRPENVEKLRISLAFKAVIYYNNVLYNVVGPRLMQGLAKLRKVAEVFEVGFNYLKLPQIANSKRTFLAT